MNQHRQQSKQKQRSIRSKFRRISRGFLLVVIALLISHAVWGRYEARQLRLEIDILHAAGEPVDTEDFNMREVHPLDPDNAAFDIDAADSIITEPTNYYQILNEVLFTPPIPEKMWPYLSAMID